MHISVDITYLSTPRINQNKKLKYLTIVKSIMKQPQEIEVWYLIPSLRRKIARCMVKKHGLSQRKTAELLGITESAVSQYVNEKRAKDSALSCGIAKAIESSSKRMINRQSNFIIETQKLLRIAQKDGTLCSIHKKYDCVPEKCNYCGR